MHNLIIKVNFQTDFFYLSLKIEYQSLIKSFTKKESNQMKKMKISFVSPSESLTNQTNLIHTPIYLLLLL